MLKIINLSLLTKDIPERFDITQYSIEPEIGFNITDVKLDSDVTARIYAEKPSGFKVYSACSILNNIIRFTPTTQMFAEVGITKMQLQITVAGNLLYSFLIYANVTPNIIDDSAVESQDDFSALQQAISTLGQYDGRLQMLEDHTVKDNEDGMINGKLSISGEFTTESNLEVKGGTLRISNLGTTYDPFQVIQFINGYGSSPAYIKSYDITGQQEKSVLSINSNGPLIIGSSGYAEYHSRSNDDNMYIGSNNGSVYIETNTGQDRKSLMMGGDGKLYADYRYLGLLARDRLNGDGSNNKFPVFTVGDNLWIGKSQTNNSYAHTGGTYISSGVRPEDQWETSGKGYRSIYISVPTAATINPGDCAYVSSATNYEVFHAGYLDVSKATDGTLPAARGGTGSSAYGEVIYNLNGSTQIADKTIASGTDWVNLGSFSIESPGIYLVIVYTRFASNASGNRRLCISDTATGGSIYNQYLQQVAPVSGAVTTVQITAFLNVTSANKTYYVNAAQNSGSSISTSTRLACLRLK